MIIKCTQTKSQSSTCNEINHTYATRTMYVSPLRILPSDWQIYHLHLGGHCGIPTMTRETSGAILESPHNSLCPVQYYWKRFQVVLAMLPLWQQILGLNICGMVCACDHSLTHTFHFIIKYGAIFVINHMMKVQMQASAFNCIFEKCICITLFALQLNAWTIFILFAFEIGLSIWKINYFLLIFKIVFAFDHIGTKINSIRIQIL